MKTRDGLWLILKEKMSVHWLKLLIIICIIILIIKVLVLVLAQLDLLRVVNNSFIEI